MFMKRARILSYLFLSGLLLLTTGMQACAAGSAPALAPEQPPLPEISVSVPQTVGDGQAMLVSLTARPSAQGGAVRSVTFSFLGRSITAKALPVPGRPSEVRAEVLLPVPLDYKEGRYELRWDARFSGNEPRERMLTESRQIQVTSKEYPVQPLTVEKKYVTPDPALKERIARETKQLVAALRTVSPVRYWTLPLARPVPGTLSSVFGLRRVLNGQPRGAHKGVDFRGKTGEPIKSMAPGKVVLTGDFYYPGKFVAVDHGLGVVSISMHMSEVKVAAGQTVKTGDVLGLIGATGRVTGPHLHLGLSVLGQSVDALPLLDAGPNTWEPKDKDTP